MGEYMTLFVTVIAFVCGWILGAFLMLSAFHYIPKRFPTRPRKNRKVEKKYKYAPYYHSTKEDEEDEDYVGEIYEGVDDEEDDELDELDETESDNSNPANVSGGLLRKRLGKDKESWTKFCCDFDGKDETEHIENSRKKEDSSYHYTKHKKK